MCLEAAEIKLRHWMKLSLPWELRKQKELWGLEWEVLIQQPGFHR